MLTEGWRFNPGYGGQIANLRPHSWSPRRPARMRTVTTRPTFEIRARDSGSRARAGTLHLAHGDVATPAFVPLATRGAVKTLEPRDGEAPGYELVLGNTFHLFLSPGPERIGRLGGLNRFMRWQRPIIT